MLDRLLDQLSGGGLPAILAAVLFVFLTLARKLRPRARRAPPPALPTIAEARPSNHVTNARVVLIVDDDEKTARVLVRLLCGDIPGLDAVAATSGPEALALARARPFDLLVVDVSLRTMSGPELVRQLRDEGTLRNAHVVLMSGFAREELAEIAESCGASAWLAKPFDATQLAAIVRRLLHLT